MPEHADDLMDFEMDLKDMREAHEMGECDKLGRECLICEGDIYD